MLLVIIGRFREASFQTVNCKTKHTARKKKKPEKCFRAKHKTKLKTHYNNWLNAFYEATFTHLRTTQIHRHRPFAKLYSVALLQMYKLPTDERVVEWISICRNESPSPVDL